jgi:copper chaperone CopZ
VSVALNKVEGIASVDVTLKRGVAHLVLKPGNTVTLAQLRKIIKDAGYTTGEAVITARGAVVVRGDRLELDVTGTATSLIVAADAADPQPFARLRMSPVGSTLSVEVTGAVAAPAANHKGPDTLLLRSFTITP